MLVASLNNLILSDGSIIAAGWPAGSTPICYALAKYGSNGVLSTKTASAVSTGSGSAYSGEHCGIALQANAEKIVTAGWVNNSSGDSDFFIARYNVSNLGLDTSFDGDGMLSTTFGSGNTDVAYGVAIQPDGRIIAAGSTTTPGSGGATDFAVARYKLPAGLDQRHFAQHRLSVVSPSRPASRPRAFACPSVRDDPASLFHPSASVCTAQTIPS